jgi:DNA polymerase-3 subunit chi
VTKVRFLHGAPDRLAAAADWLRQAWEERRAVFVFAPEAAQAQRLDHLLWSQPATGFVPHCAGDSPLAGETPIVIAADPERAGRFDCLLNLGNEVPPAFSRFEELVEIVSVEEEVRLPARERFKFYRQRGYALDNQDISQAGGRHG